MAADHATVLAIQGLNDYQPVNPTYSIAQLLELQATLRENEQAERATEVAFEQARKARCEASHAYHDAVVGARSVVVSQYGPDAAAVALVGRTRKSDRKRPARRQPKAE